MDMAKYVKMFISESQGHLQSMDGLLLELERGGTDRAAIDALFREAHSLKGMAASMGYEELARVAHRMEDFLDRYRKEGEVPGPGAVDLLFEGVDLLRQGVERLAAGSPPSVPVEPFLERFATHRPDLGAAAIPAGVASLGGPAPLPPELQEVGRWAAARDLPVLRVEVRIVEDAPLPTARAYITLKRLMEMVELVRASPTLEEIRRGHFGGRIEALVASSEAPEALAARLRDLPEVGRVTVERLPLPAAAPEAPASALALPGLPLAAASAARPGVSAGPFAPARRAADFVRVDTLLLDTLIDQVGEMLTAKGGLVEYAQAFPDRAFREMVGRMETLILTLHQQAMKLRMMPLGVLADRFPRAIRDLARRQGKEIEFQIIGGEIEMDRAILEALPDPLMHILRNSTDHGIEPPEERERAGKPRTGTIRLEAFREKEGVVIRIADDGRGIDPERVRAVALQRGILTPEQAERMSREELVMMVTAPGFSTAEAVTDVSGRGVGMDVVRATLEAMRGHLLIESEVGVGTEVILKLPLTLGVIPVLMVRTGPERYAIPVTQVQQSAQFSAADVRQTEEGEVIVRGRETIPLLSLRVLLQVPDGEGVRLIRMAVLSEIRGRTVAVGVDEILGYRDAVVKPLGPALKGLRGFGGVTILPSGESILILDLNTLLLS